MKVGLLNEEMGRRKNSAEDVRGFMEEWYGIPIFSEVANDDKSLDRFC